MLLSEPLLLPVPDGLPTELAALTEPVSVGYHAVEMARLNGDEVPLVVGCGPVCLAVILALKNRGRRPIYLAPPNLKIKAERKFKVDAGMTQPAKVARSSWSGKK